MGAAIKATVDLRFTVRMCIDSNLDLGNTVAAVRDEVARLAREEMERRLGGSGMVEPPEVFQVTIVPKGNGSL